MSQSDLRALAGIRLLRIEDAPRGAPLIHSPSRLELRPFAHGLFDFAPGLSAVPRRRCEVGDQGEHCSMQVVEAGKGIIRRRSLFDRRPISRSLQVFSRLGHDEAGETDRILKLQAHMGEHVGIQNLQHRHPADQAGHRRRHFLVCHRIVSALKNAIEALFARRVE
jgi:hypothetical protein